MPRCIKNGEAAMLCIEVFCCDLDGDTSSSLFFSLVHNICKLKAWLFELLTHFFIFSHLLFVDVSHFIEQVASQGRLARVYMTNNDDIDIVIGWLTIRLLVTDFWVRSVQSSMVNHNNNLFHNRCNKLHLLLCFLLLLDLSNSHFLLDLLLNVDFTLFLSFF